MASSSNILQPVLKLQKPTQLGNREYIPKPNTAEERAIYASQVIIPFELSGKTCAFMGPLPGENSSLDKFFPAYYKTRPLVRKIKIDDKGNPILEDANCSGRPKIFERFHIRNTESPPNFIYSKGKGKIMIKPMNKK